MTTTGFIMADGRDISAIFEPYSGGTKAALTNYVDASDNDLNERFDPHTGVDASATGFFVVDGVGVSRDLNKVFAKAKAWNTISSTVDVTNFITFNFLDFSPLGPNEIYAGGAWSGTPETRDGKRLAKYNGTNWVAMGLSVNNNTPGFSGTYVRSIYAVSSSLIYIAGTFNYTGATRISTPTDMVATTNGTSYTFFSNGPGNQYITTMHYAGPNEIYIGGGGGGLIVCNSSGAATSISNTGSEVTAICSVDASFVYVCSKISSKPVFIKCTKSNNTGSTIYTHGSGSINTCWGVDNSNIFIGGNFTNGFGVSANYIVKYNGNINTFTNINSTGHINGIVRTIHFENANNIYVVWNEPFGISASRLSKYDNIKNTWTSLISLGTGDSLRVKVKNNIVYIMSVQKPMSYKVISSGQVITTNNGILYYN